MARDRRRSLTYWSWKSMMRRCYESDHSDFHNYGKKGIKVCSRWHKFENFLKDMGYKEEGESLDRIDNFRGYNKRNCRWTSPYVQSINRAMSSRNRSGYRGVSWNEKEQKWKASIKSKRKTFNLGTFENPALAAHEYNKAAIWVHGQHACLNPVGGK